MAILIQTLRLVALVLAFASGSCLSLDRYGARCDPDGEPRCPAPLVCGVHRERPDDGTRCIYESERLQGGAGVGTAAGLRLVRSGFVVVMGPSSIEPWGVTERTDAGALAPGLKGIVPRQARRR